MLFVLCSFGASAQSDGDTVLNRYSRYILKTIDRGDVRSLERGLKDGHWSDIDYEDSAVSKWKVTWHLRNLRALALEWSDPSSQYYHNEELFGRMMQALDIWTSMRYRNSNWWHNEIGVPQYMRDIIVLLRSEMTPEQMSRALAVLGQLKVPDKGGAGANLVWSADLGFHYGILTGDTPFANRCRDLLVGEIRRGPGGEGIQPDNSFHQHGPRLQMFQYGKSYFIESVRLAWQMQGTEWQYPAPKVDILSDFVLEGAQWMARGVNTVPGTMDRSSSRMGELRSPDIRFTLPLLEELDPAKRHQYRRMFRAQEGHPSLSGFRHFPYSDFMAYHTPDFTYFLKTISDRTLATENINNENLRGRMLNSGDGYVVAGGNEYFDLMPLWRWDRLPGVTVCDGAYEAVRRSIVGSLGNGASGCTAMDYCMADSTGRELFSARKFWACHGGTVVALIGGVSMECETGEFVTVIDQCRRQGDFSADGRGHVSHNNITYSSDAGINASVEGRTGSWYDINRGESTVELSDEVLTVLLPHKGDAVYSISASDKGRTFDVMRNDSTCQAVAFGRDMLMAVFYSPSELSLKGRYKSISVNKPCLVMIDGRRLWIGDPQRKGGTVDVRVDGKEFSVDMQPYKDVSVTIR